MGRVIQKNLETRESMFRYIVQYKAEHDGVAPTIREISAALGLSSTSHVSYLLKTLEVQGRIATIDGQPRSIMVTGGNWTIPA